MNKINLRVKGNEVTAYYMGANPKYDMSVTLVEVVDEYGNYHEPGSRLWEETLVRMRRIRVLECGLLPETV